MRLFGAQFMFPERRVPMPDRSGSIKIVGFKLKRCPFCDCSASLFRLGNGGWVECDSINCGATMPFRSTLKAAVSSWNGREPSMNNQPEGMSDRSVSGKEAKMGIKIIPVDDNDAIAGLNRIFDDLQTRFHDEWDWMNAGFYVEILRCTIEDLREQQPTSPEPTPIPPPAPGREAKKETR